jgi:hypothetical protein
MADLDPILPNTIFPILHIFVRFSHKYVYNFLQFCEKWILPNFLWIFAGFILAYFTYQYYSINLLKMSVKNLVLPNYADKKLQICKNEQGTNICNYKYM